MNTVSGIPFCKKKSKSRFFSLSSFSQQISHWLAQAAYREKLGLAYAHIFSRTWSNVECGK